MSDPSQEPRSGDLGARLRALRREYPTLAVLTEIIHIDERRVTFQATVRIDGETRAQGHAAQGVDPAGDFVAAAERLAVAQALLLGGFGTTQEALPTPTARAASSQLALPEQPTAPIAGTVATAGSVGHPAPRRARRPAQPTRAGVSPPDAGDDVATIDLAATLPESLSTAAISPVIADGTDPDETAVPTATAELSSDPRRKRDRRAERGRARARQTVVVTGEGTAAGTDQPSSADTPVPEVAAEPPVPEDAPASGQEGSVPPAEVVALAVTQAPSVDGPTVGASPEVLETPLTAAPRRAPARSSVAARQVAPAPDEPVGWEALRAAWRVGQPIPAWWPPDRRAVTKPLTKSQVDRLRAVALDEEITAAQLDSYSTMIFGSGVAGLDQAQGAILEERLNPVYPSPLQELRARRVLHPLAVGDTVAIPDGSSAFLRWRDVPPAEDTPASPAQVVPSWRAGGNRRRR